MAIKGINKIRNWIKYSRAALGRYAVSFMAIFATACVPIAPDENSEDIPKEPEPVCAAPILGLQPEKPTLTSQVAEMTFDEKAQFIKEFVRKNAATFQDIRKNIENVQMVEQLLEELTNEDFLLIDYKRLGLSGKDLNRLSNKNISPEVQAFLEAKLKHGFSMVLRENNAHLDEQEITTAATFLASTVINEHGLRDQIIPSLVGNTHVMLFSWESFDETIEGFTNTKGYVLRKEIEAISDQENQFNSVMHELGHLFTQRPYELNVEMASSLEDEGLADWTRETVEQQAVQGNPLYTELWTCGRLVGSLEKAEGHATGYLLPLLRRGAFLTSVNIRLDLSNINNETLFIANNGNVSNGIGQASLEDQIIYTQETLSKTAYDGGEEPSPDTRKTLEQFVKCIPTIFASSRLPRL